jgi:putative ABC transport system permease protein
MSRLATTPHTTTPHTTTPHATTPHAKALRPARLRPSDVARVGGSGLRTRPLRAFLSALGIAIGIAAMVAVVGISASSRAGLDQRLARIGTNLLTVAPGKDLSGTNATLPDEAVSMVSRIDGVTSVSAIGAVDAAAYRNDHVPSGQTNGISVLGVRDDLLAPVGSQVTSGAWFNAGTAQGPTVVLGASAAGYLGIRNAGPDVRIWLGDQWFTVIGILGQTPLASELDSAAMVGWVGAERYLGFDGKATTLYIRIRQSSVTTVHGLLGRTVNPEHPNEVNVERPSDALAVKQATDTAFTGLLLGLGGVALLVGGVGVANTMVISVLERRGEVGLRRALGATRGQIRMQFLTESLLLSALGGLGGVLLGAGVTGGYALTQGWPAAVPAWVQAGGVGATMGIGMLAGLYPAMRAARLAPTEALGSP